MSQYSIEEKQRRIAELKAAVADLEAQLIQDRLSSQRVMIDDLEAYFTAVESKFGHLKLFWQSIKHDCQSRKDAQRPDR